VRGALTAGQLAQGLHERAGTLVVPDAEAVVVVARADADLEAALVVGAGAEAPCVVAQHHQAVGIEQDRREGHRVEHRLDEGGVACRRVGGTAHVERQLGTSRYFSHMSPVGHGRLARAPGPVHRHA
jgi:hypothetical protein